MAPTGFWLKLIRQIRQNQGITEESKRVIKLNRLMNSIASRNPSK
jgi:hypothetical protein